MWRYLMLSLRGDVMGSDGQKTSQIGDNLVTSRVGSDVIIGGHNNDAANSNGGITIVTAKPHGGFMYTPPGNNI